ncbi:hypothetical protein MTR_3g109460 [Medicago truncatula]|uniref:Uncharacterized protein n=1 Tax=Medicago truncatula TaxID=3880 RepID=G7J2X8_MEDTR|nr:hypothetical protein MTR_3g109460 [Medicago truncatula]
MRMLHLICGKTMNDRIRNDNIRESRGNTYDIKDHDEKKNLDVRTCREKIRILCNKENKLDDG